MSSAIASLDEWERVEGESARSGRPIALLFWARWHEPSKQILNQVWPQISTDITGIIYASVDADAVPNLAKKFAVASVPTVLTLSSGSVKGRVDGANVPAIIQTIKAACNETQAIDGKSPAVKPIGDRLKSLVESAPVMLFMKGSPDSPQCGFSRQIVSILRDHQCTFSSFDILQDNEVREGLKKYSNWPTYPQLYVKGNLLGGLDIVKELVEEGELGDALEV